VPWFKVDDKLHDHRKPRKAQKAAMGVWTLAGSWCADNTTDGFVPASVLTRWGNRGDARRLVEAGLWHPAEQDGEKGWLFHDWSEYQPTKEQVAERRKANTDRIKAWRDARRKGKADENNDERDHDSEDERDE
jgi:hypothetical protein